MEVHLQGCPNAEGEVIPRQPAPFNDANPGRGHDETTPMDVDSVSSQEGEPARNVQTFPLPERREPEAHVANHEQGRGTNATPSALPPGGSTPPENPRPSETIDPSLTHGAARVRKDGAPEGEAHHDPTTSPLTHGKARVEGSGDRENRSSILAETDAASTRSLGVFSFFPRPPPSDASGLEPAEERMKDFAIPETDRSAPIFSTNARRGRTTQEGK